MGRRRASNFDDPPSFHRKGTVWYHVSGTAPRLWTKLSNDRAEALRLWAQREGVREDDSTKLFSVIARRYAREVYPTKSVQTRRDKEKEMANLLKVFAHMPIDVIAPVHIREYLDIRGQVAKVRVNREKALFSHLFNKAREWGYTATQNPCQGVRSFKETGRSRHITDEEFDQVKAQAHFKVVDAMDLALLTGQRPADVFKLRGTDIRDGTPWIVQNKIGARLGIEITGELASTIARINERPRRAISVYLIQDENGQPLTQCALRSRFDKARTLAKVDFQFSIYLAQDCNRQWRLGTLAEAALAQEPVHGRALRQGSDRGTDEAAAVTRLTAPLTTEYCVGTTGETNAHTVYLHRLIDRRTLRSCSKPTLPARTSFMEWAGHPLLWNV